VTPFFSSVPDSQPYVLIKLGGQRKRGGKYFKYNGQPLAYPAKMNFEISFYKTNETKGTIKYVDKKTYNADFLGKKIGLVLNKLSRANDGQYGLDVEVTDHNGNSFRNKKLVWFTHYGCINMNDLEKDRTLFIYQIRNNGFVSYDTANGGNAVNDDDDDVFVPFDEEKDYAAYLGSAATSASK
jgi:hypothetical protein